MHMSRTTCRCGASQCCAKPLQTGRVSRRAWRSLPTMSWSVRAPSSSSTSCRQCFNATSCSRGPPGSPTHHRHSYWAGRSFGLRQAVRSIGRWIRRTLIWLVAKEILDPTGSSSSTTRATPLAQLLKLTACESWPKWPVSTGSSSSQMRSMITSSLTACMSPLPNITQKEPSPSLASRSGPARAAGDLELSFSLQISVGSSTQWPCTPRRPTRVLQHRSSTEPFLPSLPTVTRLMVAR
mmetsp:Transcript_49391/g.92589  ORF Transcript_49391/g.92589 Transcript_49391/m.92589 type:complete len:238 (+) Transcript_49391:264-977(+)